MHPPHEFLGAIFAAVRSRSELPDSTMRFTLFRVPSAPAERLSWTTIGSTRARALYPTGAGALL